MILRESKIDLSHEHHFCLIVYIFDVPQEMSLQTCEQVFPNEM